MSKRTLSRAQQVILVTASLEFCQAVEELLGGLIVAYGDEPKLVELVAALKTIEQAAKDRRADLLLFRHQMDDSIGKVTH